MRFHILPVRRLRQALPAVALSALLAACSGGHDPKVSGTLSGLGTNQAVTLQNNLADTTTLTANGSFTFPNALSGGMPYNVTVYEQPQNQRCTVTNGYGDINQDGDDVDSVVVTCIDVASLGGTVTGLPAGSSVTLANDTQQLPIATNGEFLFANDLTIGASYNVTVSVQPVGATCVVANGQGVASAATAVQITVTCR